MKHTIQNKEAKFNYEILDEFEAGLILKGDEIKSIRANRVNLKGSYVKLFYTKKGQPEVFLVGSRFYSQTLDPYRTRKLLLHQNEIKTLIGKTAEKGLTIVPLSIYIKNGKAKIKIALGRGKKLYDKRASIREKELNIKQKRILDNLG